MTRVELSDLLLVVAFLFLAPAVAYCSEVAAAVGLLFVWLSVKARS